MWLLNFFGTFCESVWWCSGKGERLRYERSGFEVQVRPWAAIYFLFNRSTPITGQKFSVSHAKVTASVYELKGQLQRPHTQVLSVYF